MNLKKMTALLLALAMTAAFCACSSESASVGVIGGADGPTSILVSDKAATELDLEATAVQVGDRVITVGDVQSYYNDFIAQFSMYGMAVPTADADIETIQDEVITMLIEQEMLAYQAEKGGYMTLTAEQEAEIAATIEEEKTALIDYYKDMVTEETADEEALYAAAMEKINEAMVNAGLGMDFETYCVDVIEAGYRESYGIMNLEKAVKAEATIEEADAKTYYDTLLSEHQTAIAEDALTYLDVQQAYEMNGGEPALVVPEGFVRVKVLTVEPKEALSADYDVLLTEMADLEAEYGNLALNGTDSARQSEIKTLYKEKKTTSDALWETYVKDARAKAEEAYGKLEAGEAFDSVFAAYGEDLSYSDYPVFAEKGCLLTPDTDDGAWDNAIREAAKTLTVGGYSDIVEIDGSYHIVYLVSEEEARELPYEEVEDVMLALALAQRQATLWEEQQEIWSEDPSIVTHFEENYRGIGK